MNKLFSNNITVIASENVTEEGSAQFSIHNVIPSVTMKVKQEIVKVEFSYDGHIVIIKLPYPDAVLLSLQLAAAASPQVARLARKCKDLEEEVGDLRRAIDGEYGYIEE